MTASRVYNRDVSTYEGCMDKALAVAESAIASRVRAETLREAAEVLLTEVRSLNDRAAQARKRRSYNQAGELEADADALAIYATRIEALAIPAHSPAGEPVPCISCGMTGDCPVPLGLQQRDCPRAPAAPGPSGVPAQPHLLDCTLDTDHAGECDTAKRSTGVAVPPAPVAALPGEEGGEAFECGYPRVCGGRFKGWCEMCPLREPAPVSPVTPGPWKATWNHTRGDSPLTPCWDCWEVMTPPQRAQVSWAHVKSIAPEGHSLNALAVSAQPVSPVTLPADQEAARETPHEVFTAVIDNWDGDAEKIGTDCGGANCSFNGCRRIQMAMDKARSAPPATAGDARDVLERPVAYPIADWHEDDGNVLWWRFPIQEPPWVGTMLDDDFEHDYYTHWTRIVEPNDMRST